MRIVKKILLLMKAGNNDYLKGGFTMVNVSEMTPERALKFKRVNPPHDVKKAL